MWVLETQHVEACWGLGFVAVNMPIRSLCLRRCRWLIRRCADRHVYADTPLLCYLRRCTLRFYAVTPLYIYIGVSMYRCIGARGVSVHRSEKRLADPNPQRYDMLTCC